MNLAAAAKTDGRLDTVSCSDTDVANTVGNVNTLPRLISCGNVCLVTE